MCIGKRTRRGRLAYAGITNVRSSWTRREVEESVATVLVVSICDGNEDQARVRHDDDALFRTKVGLLPFKACATNKQQY